MVSEISRVIWECPNPDCTYVRWGSTSEHWLNRMIDHPLWGKVTQRMVANYDITAHDCEAHRKRVVSLQVARVIRGEKRRVYI